MPHSHRARYTAGLFGAALMLGGCGGEGPNTNLGPVPVPFPPAPPPASVFAVERASQDNGGIAGDAHSQRSRVTPDGRFVVFDSFAANFGAGNAPFANVYLHDFASATTELVNVALGGPPTEAASVLASISADGRFVAFTSFATNLVPDDTNLFGDVFVRDRVTQSTTRVSVSTGGQQGNSASGGASIAADGRFVAFSSFADNLVPNDTNSTDIADVFVHDRQTGETTRVSVASDGSEANGGSANSAISSDGRFVAFVSDATNLVPNDTNGQPDIFVHDRQTGVTTRVSVSSTGAQADGPSGGFFSDRPIAISQDGNLVAFESVATNLVPDDTNGFQDIFLHDRQSGQTTRVSLASDGTQANANSFDPDISPDASTVAWDSTASNLVADDTNDASDAFARILATGVTRRLSVTADGGQVDAGSFLPSLTQDGSGVTFDSLGTNLVPGGPVDILQVFRVIPNP